MNTAYAPRERSTAKVGRSAKCRSDALFIIMSATQHQHGGTLRLLASSAASFAPVGLSLGTSVTVQRFWLIGTKWSTQMTSKAPLFLATALMLICSGPLAMGQTRTAAKKPDPAIQAQQNTALLLAHAMNPWAATSRSEPARGRIARAAQPTRTVGAVRTTATKPDPAIQAQQNTALLLAHAMNPWAATTRSEPARSKPARAAQRTRTAAATSARRG
jgi:hypothetical protein